jgi:N,N'-diacetylchitobiose transport system permease protein
VENDANRPPAAGPDAIEDPAAADAGSGAVAVAVDVAATVPPAGTAGGGPVPPVAGPVAGAAGGSVAGAVGSAVAGPGVAPAASRGRRRTGGSLPYALVVPSVLLLVGLLGYPLYVLVRTSFQQLDLRQLVRRQTVWTGLDNYTTVLSDSEFWSVAVRTLVFAAVCVALTIGVGTLVALLMRRVGKAMRLLVSAGLLLAWATPPVSAATVFRWVFDEQYGVVNWAVTALTPLDWSQHSWFADRWSAFSVIILCVVWQAVPFVALTLYAGLTTVPDEVLEAARIDGCGAWRSFWNITAPMLKPIFLILTSLSVIWDLKVFTQVYVITRGGPQRETVLLNLYTYNQGFGVSRFGIASAAAVITVALTLLVTVW